MIVSGLNAVFLFDEKWSLLNNIDNTHEYDKENFSKFREKYKNESN